MEEQKYHIEENTVQETLVIPLYGKKCCAEKYPQFFKDPAAEELFQKIDYDWSGMKDNFITRFGVVESGMRAKDLAIEIRDYLALHPEATVVNLGAGLDDMKARVDNGRALFYNLDYPDVIKLREELMPQGEREVHLAVDLNNHAWMKEVEFDPEKGIVFVASGVFYYFTTEDMKALLTAMEEVFPGGKICFDTGNSFAKKVMIKNYLQGANMSIGAFFCVDDPAVLKGWMNHSTVSERGYMTGYEPLDQTMPFLYRILGKLADGKKFRLRIIRIDFAS